MSSTDEFIVFDIVVKVRMNNGVQKLTRMRLAGRQSLSLAKYNKIFTYFTSDSSHMVVP